jgi:hypothetical protein
MDEDLNPLDRRSVVYIADWVTLMGCRFDPAQDKIIERFRGPVTERERKIREGLYRFKKLGA